MTIQIKHAFISLKGDGTDATQVQPSNWNALHSTSMASGNLIGRLSAGVGVFEEIPVSAYMAGLLAAADAATLATMLGLFTTGDVKYTFAGAPPAGWIMMVGGNAGNTIGNAASGGTARANADCLPLFTLIYNLVADGSAPVSGGRTGNPTNDFNANKTIVVPNLVGRSPIGAGTGIPVLGISARVLGAGYGEENHVLIPNELASHFHSAGIFDPGHQHAYQSVFQSAQSPGGGGNAYFQIGTQSVATTANTTGVRVTSANGLDTTNSTGGNAGHNTIHPVMSLTPMVKL